MSYSDTMDRDPDSKLDFGVDWSDWLEAGETITTLVVTPDAGITVTGEANTGTVTSCWVEGGQAGREYKVTFRVTTSAGRVDDRTLLLKTRNRYRQGVTS
jgi:hypothetical protein